LRDKKLNFTHELAEARVPNMPLTMLAAKKMVHVEKKSFETISEVPTQL